MLRVISFIVVLLLVPTGELKTNKKDFSKEEQQFTSALDKVYHSGNVVGFSVSLVTKEKVVYNKGFGFSDVKNEQEYTKNTVQNIASISKTVIGISLLKAVEMNLLKLDDPINQYLPFKVINPNHSETPITLRHLATHTSSITDKEEIYYKGYIKLKEETPKDEVFYNHFNAPQTRVPLLNFLETYFSKESKSYDTELFSKNKPGEKFEYSNLGANLCAMAIANASKKTFKEFTQEYVFKPLKMNDTTWDLEQVNATKRSKFYLYKNVQITDYSCITYPDGGLFTSTHDLSLYLSELMKGYAGKGKLLTNKSYEELFKSQTKVSLSDSGRLKVGLFIEYNDTFLSTNKLLIGHNGGDLGVFTAMYFSPKTELGKILFVNTDIDYKDEVVPTIKAIWKTIERNENNFLK